MGAAIGVVGAIAGSVLVGVLFAVLGLLSGEPSPEMPLGGLMAAAMVATFVLTVGPAIAVSASVAVALCKLLSRVKVHRVIMWGVGAVAGVLTALIGLALLNGIYGGEPIGVGDWRAFLGIAGVVGVGIGEVMLRCVTKLSSSE